MEIKTSNFHKNKLCYRYIFSKFIAKEKISIKTKIPEAASKITNNPATNKTDRPTHTCMQQFLFWRQYIHYWLGKQQMAASWVTLPNRGKNIKMYMMAAGKAGDCDYDDGKDKNWRT